MHLFPIPNGSRSWKCKTWVKKPKYLSRIICTEVANLPNRDVLLSAVKNKENEN